MCSGTRVGDLNDDGWDEKEDGEGEDEGSQERDANVTTIANEKGGTRSFNTISE